MKGDSGPGSQNHELLIYACNWESVEVFELCQLTYTPSGQPLGISATELFSAVNLANLPPGERSGMIEDVKVMAKAVLDLFKK